MTPQHHYEALENQVREIVEAAGWPELSAPDVGRLEVIAFRASLESAARELGASPLRRRQAGSACCEVRSVPSTCPACHPLSLAGDRCVCGSSTPTPARFPEEPSGPQFRSGVSRA